MVFLVGFLPRTIFDVSQNGPIRGFDPKKNTKTRGFGRGPYDLGDLRIQGLDMSHLDVDAKTFMGKRNFSKLQRKGYPARNFRSDIFKNLSILNKQDQIYKSFGGCGSPKSSNLSISSKHQRPMLFYSAPWLYVEDTCLSFNGLWEMTCSNDVVQSISYQRYSRQWRHSAKLVE